MARDHPHLVGYYPAPPPPRPHTHHLPPAYHHHHYTLLQPPGAGAEEGSFEMTAGGGGGAGAGAGRGGEAHAPHPLHHGGDRHAASFGAEGYEAAALPAPHAHLAPAAPPPDPALLPYRKRKSSSYGAASAYDDDGFDDSRSSTVNSDKKQNHSEIEKRRRDKMNTYICELSAMVPMCGAMARKLDKLTVLRLAVQHVRGVRGARAACPLAPPRPACLAPADLNALLLRAAADCFLLVVGCDRGRLLYVSHTVTTLLHYDQSELLGQSLFDILHPKDVAKVKEQLSSSDINPRERLIDSKTMLPVKADVVSASCLCLGARRSFFCRIKCKSPPAPAAAAPAPAPSAVKEEEPATKHRKKNSEKKYCVVHCTGYLKSWVPTEVGGEGGAGGAGGAEESEAGSVSCLVAVGRALPPPAPPTPRDPPAPRPPLRKLQFVSRHAPDGKFLFVDQRVTLALGFLPQELLGTSLYEYTAGGELAGVARAHKASLVRRQPLRTPPYSFRRKDGSYATITTHFKPFRNPWTKEVECLVANNTVEEAQAEAGEGAGVGAGAGAEAGAGAGAEADGAGYKHKSAPEERDDWARYLVGGGGGGGGAQPGRGLSAESDGEEEVRRLIEAQLESHKIGAAIVQEALRRPSAESPDLLADAFPHQASLVDNLLEAELCYGSAAPHVRNNVALSAAAGSSPPGADAGGAEPAPGGEGPPASPPLAPLSLDGNGEAAMAVIMSLLEADAGLGGPVNFSGLPWPLP